MLIRSRKNKATRMGFSLIELLVVIGIIAILAAILFPMLTRAQKAGFKASCQSNEKQMILALFMYTEDYAGRTPGCMYVEARWGPQFGSLGWTERIARYMGGKQTVEIDKKQKAVYKCPQQKSDYSYGIVYWEDGMPPFPRNKGFLLGSIKNTKKMVMFYELHPRYPGDDPNVGEAGQSNDDQPDSPSFYYSKSNQINMVHDYWICWPGSHNGAVNFVFVDGHVAAFQAFDATKLTWNNVP